MPDVSIVLVGPLKDPSHFESAAREPNIQIRPPVTRPEVVALIGAADVCLIPHLRTRLTEAMSPLKLYEYLAGGAPVAALDLPPIRNVSDRVVIRSDLVEAVIEALELSHADEVERLTFAEQNSWAVRHKKLLALATKLTSVLRNGRKVATSKFVSSLR